MISTVKQGSRAQDQLIAARLRVPYRFISQKRNDRDKQKVRIWYTVYAPRYSFNVKRPKKTQNALLSDKHTALVFKLGSTSVTVKLSS